MPCLGRKARGGCHGHARGLLRRLLTPAQFNINPRIPLACPACHCVPGACRPPCPISPPCDSSPQSLRKLQKPYVNQNKYATRAQYGAATSPQVPCKCFLLRLSKINPHIVNIKPPAVPLRAPLCAHAPCARRLSSALTVNTAIARSHGSRV